ncbi:unnamed protein product [Adineta ricciae]|uniref:Uncharacterized protein n=1 Tax=Adineta ricciae TaxID=249248 RepID=A0A815GBQ5_ADIRI|nr:unnamed protein product [Adineta ricciae]CAF1354476.1 unnamed protein product [Adineta ricciae]
MLKSNYYIPNNQRYNTATETKCVLKTLSEQNGDLQASGCTSFTATAFIFMTNGQNSVPNNLVLKKNVEMIILVLSEITNCLPVTFHGIGLGEVNDQFFIQIQILEPKKLYDDFNDMFAYALDVRKFSIQFSNGKAYVVHNTDNENVAFLTNDNNDLSIVTELTSTDDTSMSSKIFVPYVYLLHAERRTS